MKKIFISAGETSGDLHAARLVEELKMRQTIEFFGLGGKNLESAGVKLLFNITDLSVVGFLEVLRNLSKFKRIFNSALKEIKNIKPDCCILVDYPGFNLRLAREIKKLNIPVVYYISPQVWAWGKGRIKAIKRDVDKMIVLFDFEKELYKSFGVDAESVGHPLLDLVDIDMGPDFYLRKLQVDKSKKIIALLPGSRKKEVSILLPIMLDAARIINKKSKQINQFIFIQADNIANDAAVDCLLKSYKDLEITTVKEAERYNALFASDFAIVASGTATLETMLLSTPMVIIYKLNLLSWLLARLFIRIPYIGLVNVVAGEKIVPELIQFNATAGRIAKASLDIILNKEKYKDTVLKLDAVKKKLGEPGASARAAEIISRLIKI